MHSLREHQQKTMRLKQLKKNEIKTLNEHETVGNQSFLDKLSTNKQRQKENKEKFIQKEHKIEKEWNAKIKSVNTGYHESQSLNKRLNEEIAEYQQKINEVLLFLFIFYF